MFGLTSKSSQNPARNALTAALAIWEGLEKLNTELSSELAAPLRIGIGIHVGVSIVGWVNDGKGSTLQFLGETGNIAAKLEEQTKILGCTLAVSSSAASAAGLKDSDVNVTKVSIPGKSERLAVATFHNKDQLIALLAGINNVEDDANVLAGIAR
jgi:adenylate cyclase